MIDIRFYQAAVVVIPTLLIAVGLVASATAGAPRTAQESPRRPSAGWSIAPAIAVVCFVVVAELLALVSLAAGHTAVWSFVVVLAAVAMLLSGLAVLALRRVVEPLHGTWLDGVEWLVVLTTAVFAAAAISLALLSG